MVLRGHISIDKPTGFSYLMYLKVYEVKKIYQSKLPSFSCYMLSNVLSSLGCSDT